MTWTIMVCPKCEVEVMPPGHFRTRCKHCGTLYAVEDEMPDDVLDRERHRYSVQGKRVKVVRVPPADPYRSMPSWMRDRIRRIA